jgi:hypothetical protein
MTLIALLLALVVRARRGVPKCGSRQGGSEVDSRTCSGIGRS